MTETPPTFEVRDRATGALICHFTPRAEVWELMQQRMAALNESPEEVIREAIGRYLEAEVEVSPQRPQ
jgi:hypothetical protein